MAAAREREALRGREAELAVVERALRDVGDGGSRVLAVVGEAGIGKSALLAELANRAERAGFLVLAGRAAEHERDLPFGLAVDALDDHVTTLHPRRLESLGTDRELAAVLPSLAEEALPPPEVTGPERFRYHRALRALVELLGSERPLALVLDDVHWADDASVEWLLHLIRRTPRVPHLLAFAGRSVDPVPRLLGELRGAAGAEHLELGALSPDAARELLGGIRDDVAARLIDEARGNPLYLQELARVAADPAAPLPHTLIAAVQQELAGLPPASRALLDGAAVAGDPFDPELAAVAAGIETDALVPLDRLVSADLVRPTGTARGFAFRHPVVRRAVYDATPPAWRLAAHERVAAALAERGAAASLRAYHVERCARPGDERAIEMLVQAATESAGTSPATAARWYAAALELCPVSDDARRAQLLAPMAIALAAAGRLEESRATFLEAVEALPPQDPTALFLIPACAMVENILGLHREADERLLRALAELPDTAPRLARVGLEIQLAAGAAFAGDVETMRERAGAGTRTALAMRDADELWRGGFALDQSLVSIAAIWSNEPGEAFEALERATATWSELTETTIAGWPDAAYFVGFAQLLLERYEAAVGTVGRGLAVARSHRIGHVIAPLAALHAMALCNQLQLEDCLKSLEVAEEASRLQGLSYQLQWVLWVKAFVAYARGEGAEARRAAAESRALLDASPESRIRRVGYCNLATLDQQEDPERCLREIVAHGGRELERVDTPWSTHLMLVCTRASVAAGRAEEAERWAALVERWAAALPLPLVATRAKAATAEVALAEGECARAAELALEAGREQAAHTAWLEALPTLLSAARALAAAGSREAAVDTLRLVAREAELRTAWRWRDAAGSELRRLGVRLPGSGARREGTEAGGLTPREREIAALVAEGRSNKEVAAALFLSEKTIERHLSSVYAKLGLRSRTELAAAWNDEAG